MTSFLKIANQTIEGEKIIPLLASYKIIPQLICELIIDRAIQPITCTPEETDRSCQELYQHWGLISEADRKAWRQQYGMSQEQLENLATRRLRVEKFKQAMWENQLRSYFLQRKSQFDRVIYSLLRIEDFEIARELYFRIHEGEQSFDKLAREYSESPEAATGGLMGPVELGSLHPTLASLLYTHQSQVGAVQPPLRLGKWYAILRIEQFIPAQFNEFIRQRLLQEKFEVWFKDQIEQLEDRDKIWMGVSTNSPSYRSETRAIAS